MKGIRFALAMGAAGLLLAAWAAPWLAANGFGVTSLIVRNFFHAICHQRPERSFWLAGQPWAACIRCSGIYAGLATGVLLRIDRAMAQKAFFVVLALNIADVIAEFASLHSSLPWLRLILGVGLGAAASALLASREETGREILCGQEH